MVYLRRVVLVFVAAMFGIGNAMAVEETEYTVELKEQSFELRRYEPHLIAETVVDGDFDEVGSKAFSRLFKYISGNNQSREEVKMIGPVGQGAASEKIDMTSPVGQQRENDQWAVSFMMPASYSLETLPEPKDPLVVLRQVPARQIAAIRYSGFWSEKAYLLNKAKLDAWIEEKGLTVAGKAVWARYNAPFTPWFMRRNEVLVPVISPGND
jgi:effector-binding domain-containing protein